VVIFMSSFSHESNAEGNAFCRTKRRGSQKAPNSNLQSSRAPRSPNTHQSNSRESSKSKLEALAAVWSLELGISLVFGVWFFWCFMGFGTSLELGFLARLVFRSPPPAGTAVVDFASPAEV